MDEIKGERKGSKKWLIEKKNRGKCEKEMTN
jgi:hypothetical protein